MVTESDLHCQPLLTSTALGRHDWATLSMDLTRDIKGEDSRAYQVWQKAFEDGVWSMEGGSLDFYKRWVDAELGRHSFCHRELG